jgi:predicted PurR-regulated permease PerM
MVIWYFKDIFLYMVFSSIFAAVLTPFVNWASTKKIKNWQISRNLIAGSSVFLLMLIVFGIVSLFIPLFTEQIYIISNTSPDTILKAIMKPLNNLEAFLIDSEMVENEPGFLKDLATNGLANILSLNDVSNFLSGLTGAAGSFFVGFFAVLFITFFLLKEENLLLNTFCAIFPDEYARDIKNTFQEANYLISRYFRGIILQIVCVATLVFIGLSILDIKHALVIAIFAGLINIIPYLGPLIGGAFGVLIAITANLEMDAMPLLYLAIKVFTVFAITQQIDNWVLQPLIFSKSVLLHPLEIFIIIFVGARIAGPLGMFLGIPIYAIVKVIVAHTVIIIKRAKPEIIINSP